MLVTSLWLNDRSDGGKGVEGMSSGVCNSSERQHVCVCVCLTLKGQSFGGIDGRCDDATSAFPERKQNQMCTLEKKKPDKPEEANAHCPRPGVCFQLSVC